VRVTAASGLLVVMACDRFGGGGFWHMAALCMAAFAVIRLLHPTPWRPGYVLLRIGTWAFAADIVGIIAERSR
jgi:hypothetical protein